MTTADGFSLPKAGAAITAPAPSVPPRQANEAEANARSLPIHKDLSCSEAVKPIPQTVGSGLDELLNGEKGFYYRVSKDLARIAAGLRVPPADIAELVDHCWLKAAEHRHELEGADLERRLICWLRKVLRTKASNLKNHLSLHDSQSLNPEKLDLIDVFVMEDAEAAEQAEWLAALLAKGRVGHEENDRLVREHYLKGRSFQELAAALGTTDNAIDCRIRRHLAYLRSLEE